MPRTADYPNAHTYSTSNTPPLTAYLALNIARYYVASVHVMRIEMEREVIVRVAWRGTHVRPI